MLKLNNNYNKDFVFSITLTELIIMLFFLLLLISAYISLEKDKIISGLENDINQTTKIIKSKDKIILSLKNDIKNKKKIISELKNKIQSDTQYIEELEAKNLIQRNLAEEMINELIKYKMPKYSSTDHQEQIATNVKSIFKELTNQKELIEENKHLKQKIKQLELHLTLNNLNEKIDEEIKLKAKLLKDLKAIDSEEDLKDLIKKLYICEKEKLKVENDLSKLLINKKKLEEKVEHLEMLIEIKNDIRKEIISNKALMKKLETLKNDQAIDKFIKNCISSLEEQDCLKIMEELKYKRDVLKGQVKYLTRRLNINGGSELPPCWVDSNTGKPEYIFKIFINEKNLDIERMWPAYRDADVGKYKHIKEIIGKRKKLSEFMSFAREIYLDSEKNECKHFVQLYDRAVSKNGYKKKRQRIETYFYKYENR